MPEPEVVRAMRQFKHQLLMQEHEQMTEMALRWRSVENALDADIQLLAREMAEAREAGETVSPAKVYRLRRYQSLKAQTADEFQRYASYATDTITHQQDRLVEQGLDHAVQATQLSYWPGVAAQFDRLPIDAVQHMVGIAGDGKPVGDLLRQRMLKDEKAPAGWHQLTDALVQGTARGWNPRKTALQMRDALTGGLQKALVIARSEQLRVYRQASVDQYAASGVVLGQKRLTAHDGRVCIACLSDDGTVYNLNQIIPDHSSGRCTGCPIVKGMPEIAWTSGQDWFDQQPDAVQRSIMGAERFEAYKAGQIQFAQMGAYKFDPVWGGSVTVTSVQDLLKGVTPKAVPIDLRRLSPKPYPVWPNLKAISEKEATEQQEKGQRWFGQGRHVQMPPSNEERLAQKKEIALYLSEHTQLSEEATNAFIKTWASTSNDADYRSLEIQKVAAEVFGTELSDWQKERLESILVERERSLAITGIRNIDQRMLSVFEKSDGTLIEGLPYATSEEAVANCLRTMQNWTQQQFKAAGLDSLVLYRGVGLPEIGHEGLMEGQTIAIQSNVLESWSLTNYTAREFASQNKHIGVGVALRAEIPVERIICTARSGFGCLGEWEAVVVGGGGIGEDQAAIVRLFR